MIHLVDCLDVLCFWQRTVKSWSWNFSFLSQYFSVQQWKVKQFFVYNISIIPTTQFFLLPGLSLPALLVYTCHYGSPTGNMAQWNNSLVVSQTYWLSPLTRYTKTPRQRVITLTTTSSRPWLDVLSEVRIKIIRKCLSYLKFGLNKSSACIEYDVMMGQLVLISEIDENVSKLKKKSFNICLNRHRSTSLV